MLALELGARVIGINSRNLETLEVDASVPERLLPLIPNGVIAVAESGIESRADVADKSMAKNRFDGIRKQHLLEIMCAEPIRPQSEHKCRKLNFEKLR